MTKSVNAFNAQNVLKDINVRLSAYIKLIGDAQPSDKSEQYTKKGPGRKHKQGIARYIPAENDRAELWVYQHASYGRRMGAVL